MRRLASSRGQSSIEWAGLIVLVALVIAALLTAGIPQAAGRGVACSVSRALGGAGSQCTGAGGSRPGSGSPGTSGDPWNSADPVTRATWGTYVSLGDSYSAGEGLGSYEPGSSVHQSQCRVSALGHCLYHKDPKVIDGCDRSSGAYNGTVSGRYVFNGGKQTWACSGSITKDIFDPGDPNCTAGHASGQYGEGCQVNRVNTSTSLVTLSIGGNDAGFADDLTVRGHFIPRRAGSRSSAS